MHAPADWYPDPTDRNAQRWWDGRSWSEHVYTDGVQSVDPVDAAAPELHAASVGSPGSPVGEGPDDTPDDVADDDGAVGGELASTDDDDEDVREVEAVVLAAHLDAVDFFTPRTPPPPLPYPSGAVKAPQASDEPAPAAEHESSASTDRPTADGDQQDATVEAPAEQPVEDDGEEDDDLAPWTMRADAPEARTPSPSSSGFAGDVFVMPAATVHDLTSRRQVIAANPVDDDGASAAVAQSDTSTQDAHEPQAPEPDAHDPDARSEPQHAGDGAALVATAPQHDSPAPGVAADDAAVAPSTPDTPDTQTAQTSEPAHTTVPREVDGLGSGDPLGIRGALLGDHDAMPDERVRVDNRRLLRCALDERSGAVARLGTIVATQGVVELGVVGATRWAHRKRAPSLPLVRATGTGDVFFADDSQHVTLLQLSGGGSGVVARAEALLAFDNLLGWGVEHAGDPELAPDLVTVQVHGDGWIALLSDGEPIALPTEGRPTFVDLHALVAWSGALRMRVMRSGPTQDVQVAFEGHGVVIVQPSPGTLAD